MSDSKLYEKTNYLINAKFIHNVMIREYDIKEANISVLLHYNIISLDDWYKLHILPKQDREIAVGNMIRQDTSNRIYPTIKNGIIEAKKELFKRNEIQDHEVVRVANDAVYVVRNNPLRFCNTGEGEVVFKEKSIWTSFLRLDSITILFSSLFGDLKLDVIGIKPDLMLLHQDYMLNFIGNLLYMVDTCRSEEVMIYYNSFYSMYINRQLEIGYYRNLNSASDYSIGQGKYSIMDCTDISQIDISYNASLLRELYSILADMYTR